MRECVAGIKRYLYHQAPEAPLHTHRLVHKIRCATRKRILFGDKRYA